MKEKMLSLESEAFLRAFCLGAAVGSQLSREIEYSEEELNYFGELATLARLVGDDDALSSGITATIGHVLPAGKRDIAESALSVLRRDFLLKSIASRSGRIVRHGDNSLDTDSMREVIAIADLARMYLEDNEEK